MLLRNILATDYTDHTDQHGFILLFAGHPLLKLPKAKIRDYPCYPWLVFLYFSCPFVAPLSLPQAKKKLPL